MLSNQLVMRTDKQLDLRSRGGGGWSIGIMNGRITGLRYLSSSWAVSIDTTKIQP